MLKAIRWRAASSNRKGTKFAAGTNKDPLLPVGPFR
jgi:hypothetical protein